MTASASPSEASLCQTRRAVWPRTLRRTWTESWSQLEPGNWRTAKFIREWWIEDGGWPEALDGQCHLQSSILDPRVSSSRSLNLQLVVLDDGVAEELVA